MTYLVYLLKISVKILSIDAKERKLSLSYKDCFPSPWIAFKEKYNTYEDLKLAIKNFDSDRFLNKKEKIELVKGDANVTIPRFIKKNKHLVISLLWLDFDIYKPTKTALNFFIPKMAKGSLVVFDELNNPMWPGETTAFFELNKIKYRKLEIFEFEPFNKSNVNILCLGSNNATDFLIIISFYNLLYLY